MWRLKEMVVIKRGKIESARRGRSRPSADRRGEGAITASAGYHAFDFGSVSVWLADARQFPGSVVEPERDMRRLPAGNPDQVIITVAVNVFRINATRLLSFGGKMQARRPAGTERESNVFLEPLGDQFRLIWQSVAVKVRDGLRRKREKRQRRRAVQGRRFLPGIPRKSQP